MFCLPLLLPYYVIITYYNQVRANTHTYTTSDHTYILIHTLIHHLQHREHATFCRFGRFQGLSHRLRPTWLCFVSRLLSHTVTVLHIIITQVLMHVHILPLVTLKNVIEWEHEYGEGYRHFGRRRWDWAWFCLERRRALCWNGFLWKSAEFAVLYVACDRIYENISVMRGRIWTCVSTCVIMICITLTVRENERTTKHSHVGRRRWERPWNRPKRQKVVCSRCCRWCMRVCIRI